MSEVCEYNNSFGSAISILYEDGNNSNTLVDFRDVSLNSFISLLECERGLLVLFNKDDNRYSVEGSRGFLNNQIFTKKFRYKDTFKELLGTLNEPVIVKSCGKVELLKEIFPQIVVKNSYLAVPFYFENDGISDGRAGIYLFFDKRKKTCIFKKDLEGFSLIDIDNCKRLLKHVLKMEGSITHVVILKDSLMLTSDFLVSAIESKTPYFVNHSRRVLRYCKAIASVMGMSSNEALFFGAIFHDIGMVGVDQSVLRKKDPLTRLEIREIQSHVVKAMRYLKYISLPWNVEKIVYYHHERYDGLGYPDHLKGDEIPVESRIIAVADCYDALLSQRPYRRAFEFKRAVFHMKQLAGTQLDPEITNAFLKLIIKSQKFMEEKGQ